MKFVYVCRGCGSADITEKCGKLINEEEIIASCIFNRYEFDDKGRIL